MWHFKGTQRYDDSSNVTNHQVFQKYIFPQLFQTNQYLVHQTHSKLKTIKQLRRQNNHLKRQLQTIQSSTIWRLYQRLKKSPT